jgi:hypothetical protein
MNAYKHLTVTAATNCFAFPALKATLSYDINKTFSSWLSYGSERLAISFYPEVPFYIRGNHIQSLRRVLKQSLFF